MGALGELSALDGLVSVELRGLSVDGGLISRLEGLAEGGMDWRGALLDLIALLKRGVSEAVQSAWPSNNLSWPSY